jgi:hypothetical protein
VTPRPAKRAATVAAPFKRVLCDVVRLDRLLPTSRHNRTVRLAATLLSGDHPAWRRVLAARCAGRPRESLLTREQREQLVSWGVIEATDRLTGVAGRWFAVSKSDGITARPIYDARAQNALFAMADVPEAAQFNLPSPLTIIKVGLGAGMPAEARVQAVGTVIDFVSFFPSLRWGTKLQDAHAAVIGGQYYRARAPVQGSCILPLIAQCVATAIADAPPVGSPAGMNVGEGITVYLDDILVVNTADAVRARTRAILDTATQVGAEPKVVYECAHEVTVCGIDLRPGEQRWRLKQAWVDRMREDLNTLWRSAKHRDLERWVGLALWACRVLQEPLWLLHGWLHGVEATRADEATRLLSVITANAWREPRELLARPPRLREMHVVFSDGSIWGGGAVMVGHQVITAWEDAPLGPEHQQMAELAAARIAVAESLAALHRECRHLLLIVDNAGLLGLLRTGNPTHHAAVPILDEIHADLRAAGVCLWVGFVPGEHNPADAPSRGRPAEHTCWSSLRDRAIAAHRAMVATYWTFPR